MIHLYNEDKSFNTIRGACTGISDLFRYNSIKPADSQVVKDVKATLKKLSPPTKQSDALLHHHIFSIFETCPLENFVNLRDYFLIVLAFKTLFRGAEITRVKFSDMWLETVMLDTGEEVVSLFVLLEDWKTRNGRGGRTQIICEDPKHRWKCPVTLFTNYLSMFADLAKVEPVEQYNFAFCARSPLGKTLATTHLNSAVKRLAKAAGFKDKRFTGHSTRRGATTTAFRAGVERRII
jgi:integrase